MTIRTPDCSHRQRVHIYDKVYLRRLASRLLLCVYESQAILNIINVPNPHQFLALTNHLKPLEPRPPNPVNTLS